jgi:hypothetical protein
MDGWWWWGMEHDISTFAAGMDDNIIGLIVPLLKEEEVSGGDIRIQSVIR